MNYNQELSDKIENSDLYKDYLSQKEKASEKIRDSKTNNIISLKGEKCNEFVPEMFSGTEYTAKNNCVYYVVSSETQKLLCNFIAWIIAEITVDDGLEIRKTFKIAEKHKSGYDLPIIDVLENDFSNLNWVIKKWGAKCILEPTQSVKDRLRHCIQRISKNIKAESVFSFTGWKYYKDKWIYLYSGGAV